MSYKTKPVCCGPITEALSMLYNEALDKKAISSDKSHPIHGKFVKAMAKAICIESNQSANS